LYRNHLAVVQFLIILCQPLLSWFNRSSTSIPVILLYLFYPLSCTGRTNFSLSCASWATRYRKVVRIRPGPPEVDLGHHPVEFILPHLSGVARIWAGTRARGRMGHTISVSSSLTGYFSNEETRHSAGEVGEQCINF
jgi:hypothetical protein